MSEAVKNKCLMGDRPVRREDLRRVIKECQEESFWYRALPLSLTSLAVTGALLYRGVLLPNKRFGPFPKLAVAGILGFIASDPASGGRASSQPWAAVLLGTVITSVRSVRKQRLLFLLRPNLNKFTSDLEVHDA
ncbi:hypothetical protein GJAV_G00071670 [Gymnothorax javanicus]|nr:hypothetical protein GJAV_G00071670 [Gymnothorax javanicus]